MPRFGFIHDKLEIKFLILYLLARAAEPLDFPTLTDLTLIDEGVGYFEFAEAVSELIQTDHITKSEDERYAITEKGRKNGAICESSLAYSVRMRADKAIALQNAKIRRSAQVRADREARPGGGYTVRLFLDDDFENILHMELMAASETQAGRLEDNFRRYAEQIYNAVLSALLEDYGAKKAASARESKNGPGKTGETDREGTSPGNPEA